VLDDVASNMCQTLGSGRWAHGEAVQVDPIKPKLKPPGCQRLKLSYDEPLSKFAFKFNLRRFNTVTVSKLNEVWGRGLQSFTLQLNLSRV